MLSYEYFLYSNNLIYDLSIVWQDLKRNLNRVKKIPQKIEKMKTQNVKAKKNIKNVKT